MSDRPPPSAAGAGPLPSRASSFKFFTALFVLLVCLLLLGMEAIGLWQARETQLQTARVATANMARALAQHAEDTFRAADAVLFVLTDRIASEGIDSASIHKLHPLLADTVRQLPQLQGIAVFDKEGRWVVNSLVSLPSQHLSNADREYFNYHRTYPGLESRIGPALRSRSSSEWVIPVSRRINRKDGSFAGVVLTTVRLSYFIDFYQTFDIGKDGTIFLGLDNGTMLVRRPFNEAEIGRDASRGPVYSTMRAQGPVGTAMLTAKIDNIERLYSYRRLANYPLLVAAAVSKKESLAGWWRLSRRSLVFLVVVVAAIGFLGRRIVRQIDVQEKIEAELRAATNSLEAHNQSLETMAMQDGLTGLANRRHFELALEREFNRAQRSSNPLSLVMLDVDYFKQYNDLYGHPAGDACLKQVGQAIGSVLKRAGDLAARYGGEEFAVLLPDTGPEGAEAVAEKIRAAVAGLKLQHAANPTSVVTVSAGAAGHAGAADVTPLELLHAADGALYNAKGMGRNRVCMAEWQSSPGAA